MAQWKVAQWMALAAPCRSVVGSNPIRDIGGVRKGIRHPILCSKDKSVSRPTQKKCPIQSFSQGMETLYGHESFII